MKNKKQYTRAPHATLIRALKRPIKSRRKSVMRAGGPSWCVTPDAESQDQLHSGGVPGFYPVVLDFNHESEVKVKSWEGILSFHDFELDENGDVTNGNHRESVLVRGSRGRIGQVVCPERHAVSRAAGAPASNASTRGRVAIPSRINRSAQFRCHDRRQAAKPCD
jgi:hypothetical protein